MIAVKLLSELGVGYATNIRNVAVIRGSASVWGDLADLLVLQTGKLAGFRQFCTWWDEDGKKWIQALPHETPPFQGIDEFPDDFAAVTALKRDGVEGEIIGSFSVGEAKDMGLWGKRSAGGKPSPWVTAPRNQLLVRSRRRAQRLGFADGMGGVGITEDLVDAGVMEDGGPTPGARPVEFSREGMLPAQEAGDGAGGNE